MYINSTNCFKCSSSDANAIYKDDGKFTSYCFSCGVYQPKVMETGEPIKSDDTHEPQPEVHRLSVKDIQTLPMRGDKRRGIKRDTAEMFGMRVAYDESGKISHHFYPFTKDNKVVGYAEREVATKKFKAIGYAKADVQLQGQHLWPTGGGRAVTVTEGFLDALSVTQMFYQDLDDAYPVVSLPNGANTKSIANNLAWLSSFDKVVLMLDQDEPGKKAAKEIALMLPPGKAYIAEFPFKDANEVLLAGKQKAFDTAWWRAKQYSPSDIKTGADAIEVMEKKRNEKCYDFPPFVTQLNMMSYGKRLGEITILTSGTGMGKSQFCREDIYHMLTETDEKIGICSLEESPADVFTGLLALHVNRRIHLPDVHMDDTKRRIAGVELFEGKNADRILVLDHQGSSADNTLIDKVQYMIASGCKFIYIDHITIAISEDNNTNKAIDKFMSDLLKMCKRYHVHFTVVSHLRKTDGSSKSFENGGVPTLDDLKGSGSIKQVAFDIVTFVRDKMEKDVKKRNTSSVWLLKARYSGASGYAGSFEFSPQTGRLTEVDSLEDEEELEMFT